MSAPGTLRREIMFGPAYNREGYGRGAVMVRFAVHGEAGAIYFVLSSGWYASADRRNDALESKPFPFSLGYHARAAKYDNEYPFCTSCEEFDGQPCFADSSALNAIDAFDVLTDDGGEALWLFLEHYYRAHYEGGDYPPELGRDWNRRAMVTL